MLVPCPECGDHVDEVMATGDGGEKSLLCWNGHRFPHVWPPPDNAVPYTAEQAPPAG